MCASGWGSLTGGENKTQHEGHKDGTKHTKMISARLARRLGLRDPCAFFFVLFVLSVLAYFFFFAFFRFASLSRASGMSFSTFSPSSIARSFGPNARTAFT